MSNRQDKSNNGKYLCPKCGAEMIWRENGWFWGCSNFSITRCNEIQKPNYLNMSVQDFIRYATDANNLDGKIISRLKSITQKYEKNKAIKDKEIESWRKSLPALATALKGLPKKIKENCRILLETKFASNQRADAVLVGTKDGSPVIIILENKQWSNLKDYKVKIVPYTCLWNKKINYFMFVRDAYENSPSHKMWIKHPCEQVLYYKKLLEDHNKYIQEYNDDKKEKIAIYPVVFMHNATLKEKKEMLNESDDKNNLFKFDSKKELNGDIKKVPMYTGDEINELCSYIAQKIDNGSALLANDIYQSAEQDSEEFIKKLNDDGENLFCFIKHNYDIAEKSQIDNAQEKGEQEEDNQASVFEKIKDAVMDEETNKHRVFIIKGKPGTGKTVLAIALLFWLYQRKVNSIGNESKHIKVRYVEKNRAPRIILEKEMTVPKSVMLYGLDEYTCKNNQSTVYDCLICDESHRMLEYVGINNNQKSKKEHIDFVSNFIKLSKVAVFFYDGGQSVHVNDYVTEDEIDKAVQKLRKEGFDIELPIKKELKIQYRCENADSYLTTINLLLDNKIEEIKKDENKDDKDGYQIYLVNDPKHLLSIIKRKNDSIHCKANHPSRVVAGKGRTDGRDWEWNRKNKDYNGSKTIAPYRNNNDRIFTWNFGDYGYEVTFASDPDEQASNLIGCVDTCQGLDFEYVGVIIAPDLVYEDGMIKVNLERHQHEDPNITGYLKRKDDTSDYIDIKFKQSIEQFGREKLERIIKNTYRVLLSRGEKGCYIYCCDEALQQYLSNFFSVLPVSYSEIDNDAVNRKAAEQLDNYSVGDNKGIDVKTVFCPVCSQPMIRRSGPYGDFYGCSDYPNCKGTRKINH